MQFFVGWIANVLTCYCMFDYVCEVSFGVAVASFEWYFWWCMGGLLLVGLLLVGVLARRGMAWHVANSHNMGRYLTCVLQLPAKPRYTLTHNIRQSCTLATNDISSSSPVLTGEAYLRKRRLALRVKKSTSANLSQKIERQPNRFCIFQRKCAFSCAFSIWLNGWRFSANFSAASDSQQTKMEFTSVG